MSSRFNAHYNLGLEMGHFAAAGTGNGAPIYTTPLSPKRWAMNEMNKMGIDN